MSIIIIIFVVFIIYYYLIFIIVIIVIIRAIVNMEMYCGLFFSRVTWIREHCSPDSLIFVNIRDFNQAWLDEPKRIQYFILFLSKLATQERIFGICLEDPSGTVYPFIMGTKFE